MGDVLDYIALCHQRQGDNEAALATFQRSLALNRKALGEQHRDVAWTLHNIGDTQRNLRRYDEALASYQQALAIRLKVLDRRDPAISKLYDGIGLTYELKSDYANALDYYRRGLENRRAAHPEPNAEVAFSLHNVGDACKSLGRLDEARAAYEEALRSGASPWANAIRRSAKPSTSLATWPLAEAILTRR